MGEISIGKSLVNDGNLPSVVAILGIKDSAAKQWNLHGIEKVCAHALGGNAACGKSAGISLNR